MGPGERSAEVRDPPYEILNSLIPQDEEAPVDPSNCRFLPEMQLRHIA